MYGESRIGQGKKRKEKKRKDKTRGDKNETKKTGTNKLKLLWHTHKKKEEESRDEYDIPAGRIDSHRTQRE